VNVDELLQLAMAASTAFTGPGVAAHLVDRAQAERDQGIDDHFFRDMQATADNPSGASLAAFLSAKSFHENPSSTGRKGRSEEQPVGTGLKVLLRRSLTIS
jgi:hypothetical protein